METLDKATSFATWFDAFIQHASLMSVLLALFGSWCFAAWVRFPFRKFIVPGWAAWAIYTAEIVVAAVLCGMTWPQRDANWLFAWAFAVGVASPLLFMGFALLLCWKWPAAKPYLFLGQVPLDLSADTGDETRIPSGEKL